LQNGPQHWTSTFDPSNESRDNRSGQNHFLERQGAVRDITIFGDLRRVLADIDSQLNALDFEAKEAAVRGDESGKLLRGGYQERKLL
jgi:hypothetical protein